VTRPYSCSIYETWVSEYILARPFCFSSRTPLCSTTLSPSRTLAQHPGRLGEANRFRKKARTFLERFDELMLQLPVDPIESQYLGQTFSARSSRVIRDCPSVHAICCGTSPATAATSCPTTRSTVQALRCRYEAEQTTNRSTGTRKNSCCRCRTRTSSTDSTHKTKARSVNGGSFYLLMNCSVSKIKETHRSAQAHTPAQRAGNIDFPGCSGRSFSRALHQIVDETPQFRRQITRRRMKKPCSADDTGEKASRQYCTICPCSSA